jgi:hypothetical protein
MRPGERRGRLLSLVAGLAGFGALALAPGASAHTGEYARFNNCPSTTAGVFKCLYSVTEGGQIVLGKKSVPIVNPVTLQGGFSEPPEEEEPEEGVSKFFAATNGETLSKTPQPVPGGLSGLVNCKEISLGFLRASCEAIFENGLTGVNATLELARPASEIRISQSHIISETGVALKLPVKVHLENPLLGSGCFIGSAASPLIWNLTAGETAPPPPNKSIRGSSGVGEFIDGGYILRLKENKLVDNAWSAPGATGCGGFLVEYILDPIINSSVGVPSAAGRNTAILQNDVYLATAHRVNEK